MKFLAILKLVLSLLPLVIDTIKIIEQAIPGEGQGEAKLSAVRGIVEAAYEHGDDAVEKFENIWPVLQKAISTVVGLFNKTGAWSSEAK